MIVKLLSEYHLEFLSLKGGCIGSSESTHVKMPHCWKSHTLVLIVIMGFLIVTHCKTDLTANVGNLLKHTG